MHETQGSPFPPSLCSGQDTTPGVTGINKPSPRTRALPSKNCPDNVLEDGQAPQALPELSRKPFLRGKVGWGWGGPGWDVLLLLIDGAREQRSQQPRSRGAAPAATPGPAEPPAGSTWSGTARPPRGSR